MTHSAGGPLSGRQKRFRYPSGPGTATLAYLRRRRKKRKKAGGAAEGAMLALGTPAYGWEPGNVAGSLGGGWATGGGTTSRIYDQVVGTARDLVQLSVPQQPDVLEDAGKRWARMVSGESMLASGLILPAVFTLKCVFRVTAGGVDATGDAIWTLDNGAGKSLALAAGGSGSDFLGSIVGVGTDIPSIADFLPADVVDGGTQEIALEVDQTNDVMTVWANNQVRAVTAFDGTLDGTWSLRIGGAIEADWAPTYIYDGTLSAAEHRSAATYAVGYGADLVVGEWASRFTAVPALYGSAAVGAELTTDNGTTLNARGAAGSFTYAWRAETAGLIDGETTNAYTIDAALQGDKVRSEVNNTVLGQSVVGVSGYTDVVGSGEWTPAELGSALLLQLDGDTGYTLDGSEITIWMDQSGNGWSPGAPDRGPQSGEQTTTGGDDAPNFNENGGAGFGEWMVSDEGPNSSFDDVSLIALVKVEGGDSLANVAAIGGTGVNLNGIGIELTGATNIVSRNMSSGNSTIISSTAGTGWHLVVNTLVGASNFNQRADGMAVNTGVGVGGSITLNGLVLGRRSSSNDQRYFDGGIAAVVAIASSILADIQKVEGWMAHKYGEEGLLDAGHPYKSAPPSL